MSSRSLAVASWPELLQLAISPAPTSTGSPAPVMPGVGLPAGSSTLAMPGVGLLTGKPAPAVAGVGRLVGSATIAMPRVGLLTGSSDEVTAGAGLMHAASKRIIAANAKKNPTFIHLRIYCSPPGCDVFPATCG